MHTQFPANYIQHLRSYRYRWQGFKAHDKLMKAVREGQINLLPSNYTKLVPNLVQNISRGTSTAGGVSACTEKEAKRLIGQYALANEMCFEHHCGRFLLDTNPNREDTWTSSWLHHKGANGHLCFPKESGAVLHHTKCSELVESSRWYHQALLGVTQHNTQNGITIAVFNNSTLMLPNNCSDLSSVHVTYRLLGLKDRSDVLCSLHDVWSGDRAERLFRTVTEVVFLGPPSFAEQLAKRYGDASANGGKRKDTAAGRSRVKLNALQVVADACELTKDDYDSMQGTLNANTERESGWLQELLDSRHTWRNAARHLRLIQEPTFPS